MFAGERNIVPLFTFLITKDSLTEHSGLPFTVFSLRCTTDLFKGSARWV